ncbi:MAG: ribosome small subunit-dependent GTPase A [Calditrichaeota bacterium]|nr:ribosome small subunit-dependent GTPase A [Calditrichota bacterium]
MADRESTTGLVIWTMGHISRILINGTVRNVKVPGKWRLGARGKRPIATGDFIELSIVRKEWHMDGIVPRRNEFTRRLPGFSKLFPQVIAANLDLVVIVASIAEPLTPFGFIDRLLVAANLGNVPTALVVNKADLAGNDQYDRWKNNYRNAVDPIIFTSAMKKQNIDVLADMIKGRTVLFAGRSGAGKSSLANCIDPNLDIKTREVSDVTGKGKHTTSAVKLHPTSEGGWLADTPGLRECGPYGKTPENLPFTFPEIERITERCKFRDCRHKTEIGCMVTEIVGTADFPEERYKSYLKLLSEAVEEQTPEYLK